MPENSYDVIIVGGGLSGLSVAAELSQQREDLRIGLVEGSSRLGGRIRTEKISRAVAELGAEFIYGRPPRLRQLVDNYRIPIVASPLSTFVRARSAEVDQVNIWKTLTDWVSETGMPDRNSLGSLLRASRRLNPSECRQIEAYASATHGAGVDELDASFVWMSENSFQQSDGYSFNRAKSGLSQLIDSLAKTLGARCDVFTNTTVSQVDGTDTVHLTLYAHTSTNETRFRSNYVVVAVPLMNIAKHTRTASIAFNPSLPATHLRAFESLRMADVLKVYVTLNSDGSREIQRYIVASGAWIAYGGQGRFATWWSCPSRKILVAWLMGHRAQLFRRADEDGQYRTLARDLADLLGSRVGQARRWIEGVHYHDWVADSFYGGAYSYVVPGGEAARERLYDPVGERIFFVGEHTAPTESIGTMHGAVCSAHRVVRQLSSQCR